MVAIDKANKTTIAESYSRMAYGDYPDEYMRQRAHADAAIAWCEAAKDANTEADGIKCYQNAIKHSELMINEYVRNAIGNAITEVSKVGVKELVKCAHDAHAQHEFRKESECMRIARYRGAGLGMTEDEINGK